MSQHCKCDACDFEFSSGHSHHSGNSWALCTACLTDFALITESFWGPAVGELIVLQKVETVTKFNHKKKPPVVTYLYEPTDEFLIVEKSAGEYGVDYPTAHIVCPCCGLHDSLALDFTDQQACPKCKVGHLSCCSVIY